jgi:hypothetical protein
MLGEADKARCPGPGVKRSCSNTIGIGALVIILFLIRTKWA